MDTLVLGLVIHVTNQMVQVLYHVPRDFIYSLTHFHEVVQYVPRFHRLNYNFNQLQFLDSIIDVCELYVFATMDTAAMLPLLKICLLGMNLYWNSDVAHDSSSFLLGFFTIPNMIEVQVKKVVSTLHPPMPTLLQTWPFT